MSKSISIALQNYLGQQATRLCMLEKIGPLPDASFIHITSLDRDVEYDDGDGLATYYASTGAQVSNLAASNDLSVDNGETNTLVPIYPVTEGITEAMVDNGDLDGVPYVIYKVNYNDLSMGHEVMASGQIGEVRVLDGGLITFENRSWSQLLKQNSVCEVDSLTCRVKRFGSQPGEERFPCNYDLTGEWVNGVTVTGIGSESVREFSADALTQPDDYFAPGLVLWLTGDNAGRSLEVEGYQSDSNGADITLLITTRYPIQVGDTFDIRRDCTRKWSGHNSCETYNNRLWFRGEPFIPIAETVGLLVPGAAAAQNPVSTA